MSLPPLSPSGPAGLLHNYGINYNMLETILPNYGLIRRILSRKVGIDISSILGVAFIGFTLSQTCATLWRHASDFASRFSTWVTSTISLEENDQLARNVTAWAAEHISSGNTRSLTASARGGGSDFFQFGISSSVLDQFDEATCDLIMLRKEKARQAPKDTVYGPDQRDLPARVNDKMILTCFGWSASPLKKFLQHCKDFAAETEVSTTTTFTASLNSGLWRRPGITRPSRPLSTVDLDPIEKQGLVDDVTSYLKAKQFYARRGIPYRRGYLFHGPPGTGKTSLASAIAGHFKLGVYMLSLSGGVSDHLLSYLFRDLPARCVVMLEDVDSIGISEERESEEEGIKEGEKRKNSSAVTLSGLLNCIDGVGSKEGRILIMTSNVPEVLDRALIRPGRIDRQVYLGHLSKQNAKQMFLRMYTQDTEEVKQAVALANKKAINDNPDLITMIPPVTSPVVRGPPPTPGTPFSPLHLCSPRPISSDYPYSNRMEDLEQMAHTFMNKIPDQVLTPAEVQGFLLSHRDDMMGALTQCDAWVAEMLNAKQRKSNIIKLAPAPSALGPALNAESVEPPKPRPLPRRAGSIFIR